MKEQEMEVRRGQKCKKGSAERSRCEERGGVSSGA